MRRRPGHARELEIWKHSLISSYLLPFVHTNRSRKRSSQKKALQTVGLWKRGLCILVWTCEFPNRVFLNHKSKITDCCCLFKSEWNVWYVFRVKLRFSNSSVVWTGLKKTWAVLDNRVTFVSLFTPYARRSKSTQTWMHQACTSKT